MLGRASLKGTTCVSRLQQVRGISSGVPDYIHFALGFGFVFFIRVRAHRWD